MTVADVLTIAGKDLSVTRHRRSIMTALVLFPVLVGIGLPLVLVFAGRKTGGVYPSTCCFGCCPPSSSSS